MEIKKLINQKMKMSIISKNNFVYSKNFTHRIRAKRIINEINLNL